MSLRTPNKLAALRGDVPSDPPPPLVAADAPVPVFPPLDTDTDTDLAPGSDTSTGLDPTAVNESAQKSAMSILDLAEQIAASPEIRNAATKSAEELLGRMLLDVTNDNRVVISLTGQALTQYQSDWNLYNQNRIDKIPFSTYLARRINTCRLH